MFAQNRILLAFLASISLSLLIQSGAFAQAYAVELHNSLMPASGGMAGASIARPQDALSAINGNPAAMSQIRGTQFEFGGGWAEATHNLTHGGSVPGLGPFSAKSGWPGSGMGNIGLVQEYTALGFPVHTGIGLVGTAGAGAEFRDQPNSNGTTLGMTILFSKMAASVQLTDRLSIGGSFGAGMASMDAPFVGSGAMTPAFTIRGAGGISYQVDRCTTLGAYYESKSNMQFNRAIQLLGVGPFLDVNFDLPENVGIGISNSALMNGRLLLAADVLYKRWSNADFVRAIYDDQWVGIFGAQYSAGCDGRIKIRSGYAYAPNNMREVVPGGIGGVNPGVSAINYIQGLAPSIAPHRLTAGLGIQDILPGIDSNFYVGTMLESSDTFGDTSVSIKSYWIGGGMTWRFRRGSGCSHGAPDEWQPRGYPSSQAQ